MTCRRSGLPLLSCQQLAIACLLEHHPAEVRPRATTHASGCRALLG